MMQTECGVDDVETTEYFFREGVYHQKPLSFKRLRNGKASLTEGQNALV